MRWNTRFAQVQLLSGVTVASAICQIIVAFACSHPNTCRPLHGVCLQAVLLPFLVDIDRVGEEGARALRSMIFMDKPPDYETPAALQVSGETHLMDSSCCVKRVVDSLSRDSQVHALQAASFEAFWSVKVAWCEFEVCFRRSKISKKYLSQRCRSVHLMMRSTSLSQ